MGWSENPDEVKPKYTDGQTVNTLCDAGKTYELYAVWKKTDGSFDTHNIIHDDGMFNGSIELEGQNGTGFSRDHVDSEYGRIDKDGQPGYFNKSIQIREEEKRMKQLKKICKKISVCILALLMIMTTYLSNSGGSLF